MLGSRAFIKRLLDVNIPEGVGVWLSDHYLKVNDEVALKTNTGKVKVLIKGELSK